jgi:outer membrane receptor protein involved in Fe transport
VERDPNGNLLSVFTPKINVSQEVVVDNLFNDPINSQDFKSKDNLTVTWNFHDLGATAYVEHYGRTPNYLVITNGYNTPGAASLGDWTLVNFSARYELLPGLQVSVNVDNVYGRTYFVTLSYKFAGK